MIRLPKMISSKSFDCIIANATMVCMYWRQKEPKLNWNLPDDFDDNSWNSFYERGLRRFVKTAGVPFDGIERYLRSVKLPLQCKLVFLDGIIGLGNLIALTVPPIVIYDHHYLRRGIKREPYRAIVLVDETTEMLVAIDPINAPKYVTHLSKTEFQESWNITENATIIMCPKHYQIGVVKVKSRPETSLETWMERAK